MYIDLFIAPDGEFRHMTPEKQHAEAVVEPVFKPARLLAIDAAMEPQDLVIESKIFRRYRLFLPTTEIGERSIPTGPSRMWNNFLRRVIADLEAKGDAPCKR